MADPRGLPHIAPSQHNPWQGGREDRFTADQQRYVDANGDELAASRRRTDAPATYAVRMPLAAHAGDGGITRYIAILCPVVAVRRDRTRILVIAPDGEKQWVEWK